MLLYYWDRAKRHPSFNKRVCNAKHTQADAPDHSKIPGKDLLGATVVLISCSYHGQEFIRVGYFVHNDYESEELRETPPETPDISKPITRSIMAEEPRVTRFR